MQAVGYYIALPFLYFISILPFPLLYLLSDFLYIIIYYLIGYRKSVVRTNLKNSFPEKSEEELIKIEKAFFKYIVDFFLEMLKCLTISKEELLKRVSIENPEVVEELFNSGQNVIVSTGHYGNHEWINQVLPFMLPFQIKTVYRIQHNTYFNQLFLDFRSRYGVEMISMNESYRKINTKDSKPFLLLLANDQSAPPDKAFWTTFLNQETSFFAGTEIFAHRYNIPVVYGCIKRIGRGKYRAVFDIISTRPRELPKGKILEEHAKKLERDIRQDPTPWMWSHKRWKYKKINGEYIDVNYKE
ncbi:lysophospholipid acyltransferase family protein [Emticicia sp. BO119]|uniref:lysophospholipid acyltransferase family protein n=1 Tax=Emticicia sp. BO119 TaxID=2757768 RepID=UPI0015F0BC40|nr:lipid A biosynthesis acyltransferase [Emticicia sp. BO119]MBA4853619.1 lipid A biosynthesis acyltransferase [Emticicia sp. BO119]